MHRFHAIGRLVVLVAGLAAALPVFSGCAVFVAVPKVSAPLGGDLHRHPRLASRMPRPPGWNKHPPLPDPARVHALASGIPGWQVTLMAVTVVLLAATVVAIVYPGPGRAVAGEHTSPQR